MENNQESGTGDQDSTLSKINARIERLNKLKWKAVLLASKARTSQNIERYWHFSGKIAVLEVHLKNAYDARIPLYKTNQAQHEKTPIGQFLKNSNGISGENILILKDRLFALTSPDLNNFKS